MVIVSTNKPKMYILELLGVIALTLITALLAGNFKGLSMLIPLLYLLIEKKIRHRPWRMLGFDIKRTGWDLKQNWHLVILVGVIIPVLTVVISTHFVPGYMEHLKSRVPIFKLTLLIPLFLNFVIGGFGEELIFRGLFQERLRWIFGKRLALIVAAVIFSLVHFSPGSFTAVSFDLFGVFINALIYGVIYFHSRNIFASWVAHVISDTMGVLCILLFTSAL